MPDGTMSSDVAMDEALSQIRERAEAIRDEEVARACSRLQAHGDLSPEERAVVEALADRLVERLLAVPARGLAAAEEREEVAETVRTLFDD